MSKKSRKKSTRTSSTQRVAASKTPVADRPSVKSDPKKMSATVTQYMSSEELNKRYQYVKDDLKLVAIIAIPMLLVLIIAGIFIKI
jgi:hypothetical protein